MSRVMRNAGVETMRWLMVKSCSKIFSGRRCRLIFWCFTVLCTMTSLTLKDSAYITIRYNDTYTRFTSMYCRNENNQLMNQYIYTLIKIRVWSYIYSYIQKSQFLWNGCLVICKRNLSIIINKFLYSLSWILLMVFKERVSSLVWWKRSNFIIIVDISF